MVPIKCALTECSNEFLIKPSRIKRSNYICCSRECAAKIKSDIYKAEGNPNFGNKGSKNPIAKSDIGITKHGYVIVRELVHPLRWQRDFIFFHRLVFEEHLRQTCPDSDYLVDVDGFGCKFLDPNVVIHHKDGNKLNNNIDNLEPMDLGDHVALHNEDFVYVRDSSGRFVQVIGKYNNDNVDIKQLFKKHSQDAGLDISSNEDCFVPVGGSRLIHTGLYLEIPQNHVGLIWSRSGLSVDFGIQVGAGCVDSSYRGEIRVLLYNFGNTSFRVKRGDRIAQLLTVPINPHMYKYSIVEKLSCTDRGSGGFGSTGVGVQ